MIRALVAVPCVVGSLVAPRPDVAFHFEDPAIVESSGLVVLGDLVVTTNDSGDSGRVFAVSASGKTVGVTHWDDSPEDVEALAPAGPDAVWVADIGDNGSSRETIEVTRVPVARGTREVDEETIDLTYPDGPHDAETLLAHPSTGRLYVVTKEILGGTVYAAPARLSEDGSNALEPVGPVVGLATDGSFLPDGEQVVIRTYGRAFSYDFPSLRPLGSFDLPDQQQGEGLAVAPDGSLLLSSEGVRAPVLRVTLPSRVLAPPPSPSPTASPSTPVHPADTASQDPEVWPWLMGGLLGLVALGVLLRSLKPR